MGAVIRRFGPGPSGRWIANLMSESKAALEANDFARAARGFATLASVFDRRPDDRETAVPLMLSYLARAQWSADKPQKAMKTYERLATAGGLERQRGDVAFAWEAAARCAWDASDWKRGERYARAAIEANRRDGNVLGTAETMCLLGDTLWHAGRLKEAEIVLVDALGVLPPHDDDAYVSRFSAYESLAWVSLEAGDGVAAERWVAGLRRVIGGLDEAKWKSRERLEKLENALRAH